MSSVKIELRQDQLDKIHSICDSFGNQEGELINVLHKCQETFGYLPAEVQEVISEKMEIPAAKVYGVVTFYSFFTMIPQGEHPISICTGTACYVRGAENVLSEFKKELEIEALLIKFGKLRETPDEFFLEYSKEIIKNSLL